MNEKRFLTREEEPECVRVQCVICGLRKKPRGRSAPMGPLFCDYDCPGYTKPPFVGELWPGETREEFGF